MTFCSIFQASAFVRMVGVSQRVFIKHVSRSISVSRAFLANVTVDVPALGESISEGSVSSFEKAIGDIVDVDDVIAVIETDKVTVDIKSPYRGTLVALLCEVSDEITVGSALYTIDTDDSVIIPAAEEKREAVSDTSDTNTLSGSISKKNNSTQSANKRVPMIKFLGKRSLLKASSVTHPSPSVSSAAAEGYDLSPVASSYDNYDSAFLGRPLLTEAEIEAVESGGASLLA